MNQDVIISVEKIYKKYPGVIALNDISLNFKQGEVHALVGENGAGKSTLIKILSGSIQADSGLINFKDNIFKCLTPKHAIDLGISIIYQEFSLVNYLSVAENIFLGFKMNSGPFVSKTTLCEKSRKIMEELDLYINPKEIVGNLSPAYQQIVEILRALSRDVKVLIMDEPSAPLSTIETQKMLSLVKRLRDKGICIIYVSHRLEEVFEIADRVSILRDGSLIDTKYISQVNENELIKLMVGRDINRMFEERTGNLLSEPILEVNSINNRKVHNVSFQLFRGEILGIGGLVGSGRTELVRCIFGADKCQGVVKINGQHMHISGPKTAIKSGIALIPEDRKQQGLILGMSVGENITISVLRSLTRIILVIKNKESKIISDFINLLNIKTPGPKQVVRNLSGGNQQKVVLAKMLATKSNVIILDEPTRGIDVGAKFEIYEIMKNLVHQGKSIIMISSDMMELIGMSDRILVMRNGSLSGELKRSEVSEEMILKLASGITF